jgi:predicted Fe-S protein YdhL (DUF1289 family)
MTDPMCEECDLTMHAFACETKDGWVSGWSCDGCGWSWDNEREEEPMMTDENRRKVLDICEQVIAATAESLVKGVPALSAPTEQET